ncbi:unnamed protein product [Malus baccata var. baccata]
MRSSGLVDPGWDHGVAQDERKKKVKCNYCGKIVSGGIYRLKQHLARVSGEVTYCDKAPDDVYLSMKTNMEGSRSHKKPRLSDDIGQAYLNFQSNDDEEDVQHTEVMRGLNECIVRLEPDHSNRISASMQISDYNAAKADFGTELAISTRTELDPANAGVATDDDDEEEEEEADGDMNFFHDDMSD